MKYKSEQHTRGHIMESIGQQDVYKSVEHPQLSILYSVSASGASGMLISALDAYADGC